jgi:hypothetical protein
MPYSTHPFWETPVEQTICINDKSLKVLLIVHFGSQSEIQLAISTSIQKATSMLL